MLLILAFIASLLLNVLLKIPFVNVPLDRDYGIYGYHALFKLRGKKVPYRDTAENHPPGRWFLYMVLIKLFGVSRKVFRISNIAFHVFTNVVVFLLARTLFNGTVAVISSFFYAFLSSLPAYVWTQSSDEIEQILFTSLAFYCLLLGDKAGMVFTYLAGLFGVGALFFKQTAYLNTILPIFVLAVIRGFGIPGVSYVMLGMLSGFLLIYLFFVVQKIPVACFKRLYGFDRKYWRSHINALFYHTRVVKERKKKDKAAEIVASPVEEKPDKIREFTYTEQSVKLWLKRILFPILVQSFLFFVLSLFGLVAGLFEGSYRIATFPLAVWVVFVIAGILVNKHVMPYHFVPLLPPVSILAGFGVCLVWELFGSYGALVPPAVLLSLGIFYVFLGRKEVKRLINLERKGRGHIFVFDREWELNLAGEKIGKMLRELTDEQDKIYIWGPEYEVYLWSERPSPTHTLFCPRPQITYFPDPLAVEKQIVDQLNRDKPKFIVITALTEGFERFEDFLRENYALYKKVFGEIEIHIRKDLVMEKRDFKLQKNENAPLVSVIALTFNGLKYTKDFFRYLVKNTSGSYEVIFVDNGSTDGTKEYLRELKSQYPFVTVIENDRNLGFAKGNNQGMAVARGRYFMVINNDVLVPKGWMERMVKPFEVDDSIGLVGPLTNWISGLQMVNDVPYENPEDFEEFADRVARAHRNRYTPRRRIAGFAMMINRRLYETIGGFDEGFSGGNYEDDDYCLRAVKAGFKIVVAENVFMHHFGSVTFKLNNINYDDSLERNKRFFKEKWPDVDIDWLMERDERLISKSKKVIDEAIAHFGNSEYGKALEKFNKVLEFDPLNEEALFGAALCYRNLNDNLNSLKLLKKCLDVNPDNAYAYNQSGIISVEMGDLESAKVLFSTAVMKAPDLVDAQRNYADVLIELGEYEDGVRALVKILENHPDDVPTLLRMAQLYAEVGRYTEAKTLAERVLTIDPGNERAAEIIRSGMN